MPFPKLTYQGLKRCGKKVYAVDPSTSTVDGDQAYPDLGALPEKVQAVVLELPEQETAQWVEQAIAAGIRELWIHQGTDTPEALEIAAKQGITPRTGTCAVMYLTPRWSAHPPHRLIMKLLGKY